MDGAKTFIREAHGDLEGQMLGLLNWSDEEIPPHHILGPPAVKETIYSLWQLSRYSITRLRRLDCQTSVLPMALRFKKGLCLIGTSVSISNPIDRNSTSISSTPTRTPISLKESPRKGVGRLSIAQKEIRGFLK